MGAPRIAPSLLAADFADLRAEVAAVEAAGADLLHLDVMDGHFVPNITFGPPLVAAVRATTSLPLDCHLMVERPLAFLDAFVAAGADMVSVHVEARDDVREVARRLRAAGKKAGVALNPDTETARVVPLLGEFDYVLVMSVQPGFGGQRFQERVLEKVPALRAAGFRGPIEIDGGVNDDTAPLAAKAGVDILVAGTAVFAAQDRAAAIRRLRASPADRVRVREA